MLKWVCELVVLIVITCCLCITNNDSALYDSSGRISLLCRMKLSRELLPILSLFCQMLLMVLKCTTVSNGFMNPSFSWIPCSVSDGMSNSNTINNQHSPVLLIPCSRSYIRLLYIRWEKEDLINQSHLDTWLFKLILKLLSPINW